MADFTTTYGILVYQVPEGTGATYLISLSSKRSSVSQWWLIDTQREQGLEKPELHPSEVF